MMLMQCYSQEHHNGADTNKQLRALLYLCWVSSAQQRDSSCILQQNTKQFLTSLKHVNAS